MGENIRCRYTVKAEVPTKNTKLLALLMSKEFEVFEYDRWEGTYTLVESIPITHDNDDNHFYVCIYNSHTPPAPYIMKKIEEEESINYTKERRVE